MAVFRWTDKGGSDVYVKFDVVKVVELSRETDITEHPVEQGPDVSDHVRARLPRASVTAFMSNSPLPHNDGVDKLASFQNIELPPMPQRSFDASSLGQSARDRVSASGPTKVYGLVWTDLRSRVREVREKLTEAQENGYLISLTDSDGDFDDLVIERFATIRAVEDGNGATVQLEVRQIRLTTVNEVSAPEPSEVRGESPKNLGSQASKDDKNGEDKKTKMKSIAASILDGASSLF